MKYSTRTTYGLRAMIRLAQNGEDSRMSLTAIAKKEGISAKYLERLFSLLKKYGLVISEKGAAGGYKLSKKASEITVFDIISSLEGSIAPFHCLEDENKVYCNRKCDCGVIEVLGRVQKAVNSTLKNIKLSELK